eukprot:SAG11_NODE_428_length_9551_cov_6.526978_5_plen_179_part_00
MQHDIEFARWSMKVASQPMAMNHCGKLRALPAVRRASRDSCLHQLLSRVADRIACLRRGADQETFRRRNRDTGGYGACKAGVESNVGRLIKAVTRPAAQLAPTHQLRTCGKLPCDKSRRAAKHTEVPRYSFMDEKIKDSRRHCCGGSAAVSQPVDTPHSRSRAISRGCVGWRATHACA